MCTNSKLNDRATLSKPTWARASKTTLGLAVAFSALTAFQGCDTPDGMTSPESEVSVSTEALTAGDIVVTMSMPKTQIKNADGVLVNFTITNRSSIRQSIEKWKLPTQAISADILSVMRGGSKVPYIGPIVKRAAPQAADLIVLASGQSISATLDISKAYNVTATGQYTVDYVGLPLSAALKQAPVTFSIVETRTLTLVTPKVACTASQIKTLNTALNDAGNLASTARQALAGSPTANRSTAARSLKWFGAYDQTRYATVLNHYTSLEKSLPLVTFSCDCLPDYATAYAYVYPGQPYAVTLCGAFWSAPALGTDSKAGTLVHETSHFTAVAGTSDFVYGQTAAAKLAVDTPSQAIMNADNHEYFAENTPSLAMPAPTSRPTTLHRIVRNCDNTARPGSGSAEQVISLAGGYSNYTCASRWQQQCVNDGTFDMYYMEWCDYQ